MNACCSGIWAFQQRIQRDCIFWLLLAVYQIVRAEQYVPQFRSIDSCFECFLYKFTLPNDKYVKIDIE